MAKAHLKLVAPTTVLGTVAPPRRKTNAQLRPREYLTEAEIERLRKAAGENRHGFRDAAMILAAFAMGSGRPNSARCGGTRSTSTTARSIATAARTVRRASYPLAGVELRALRRVKRSCAAIAVRVRLGRGAPFTVGGFRRMIGRLGAKARFAYQVHPHMLRHACGYKLANDGVDTRSRTLPRA